LSLRSDVEPPEVMLSRARRSPRRASGGSRSGGDAQGPVSGPSRAAHANPRGVQRQPRRSAMVPGVIDWPRRRVKAKRCDKGRKGARRVSWTDVIPGVRGRHRGGGALLRRRPGDRAVLPIRGCRTPGRTRGVPSGRPAERTWVHRPQACTGRVASRASSPVAYWQVDDVARPSTG